VLLQDAPQPGREQTGTGMQPLRTGVVGGLASPATAHTLPKDTTSLPLGTGTTKVSDHGPAELNQTYWELLESFNAGSPS
jgi:hypothetical protein